MFIIVFLALTLLQARAAPFSAGPATSPTVAHAVFFGIQPRTDSTEANVRTLYDIVRSCVFTIAACVYRTIHQNIPDPTMTIWGRLRVRMKITYYALIAPEAMIWWAMRQRYAAIEIANQVNQLKYGLHWTQTHGQFTQMGGFARKDNKHVLHPRTLIELLKDGRIDLEELQLTKDDIDDKSKGDLLSKALVAFQTTWFVFECITRLQQRLPLIELEVVTLAFAVLNVITYALWWHKPLNVLRPIYLHIRETPENWPPEQIDYVEDDHDGWWKRIWMGCITRLPLALMPLPVLELFEIVEDKKGLKGVGMVVKVRAAVERVIHAIKQDVGMRGWWMTVWERLTKQPFLAVVEPLRDLFTDGEVDDEATHVSTFYGMRIPGKKFNSVLRLSCFIGIIFGAVHVLSWHSTFPTRTEVLLWRISTIVLVVQPALLPLPYFFDDLFNHMPNRSWRESIANFLKNFFRFLSFFIGPIPYILARFCLLVLALLTLHHLPPHALDSIPWTFYIPHL